MKAVIFDKDGVLIDSEKIHLDALRYAFKKMGLKIKDSELGPFIGKIPKDYADYFEKTFNASFEEYISYEGEKYFELLKHVKILPAAMKLIKSLKKKGHKLAITTSAAKDITLDLLKRSRAEGLFDVVVTNNHCKERKPHPEPYLITAKKLGVKPSECIVIEDSVVGLESAKRAGMKCIVAYNDATKNQDFSSADYVVDSLSKVKDEWFD